MTRNIAIILVGVATLSLPSLSICESEAKIGFISLTKISDESLKKKDFQEEINKFLEEKKADRDAIQKEIDDLSTAKALSGPEQAKVLDQKLRQKAVELMEFRDSLSKEIKKRQDAFEKEILRDIAQAAKEIAEEKGYSWVILEEVLVYRDDSADLTYQTLVKMNEKYMKTRRESTTTKGEGAPPVKELLPVEVENSLMEDLLKNGKGDRFTIKEIQPRSGSASGSITMKGEKERVRFISQYPKDMAVGPGGIVSAPMGDKSVWRFVGQVPLSGYTFNGPDENRPLTFILLDKTGLVHLYGKGSATFPDGKNVAIEEETPLPNKGLPQKPE